MKNLKFLLVFAFLVTTFTAQVFAQPYPITTTTQLATPQLPQLETLADPTNNTVFLSLILNDITQPTYNLRLKLVISGNGINIETNQEVFTPSPINLQYNVPVLLNGADLAEYFKLDNLRFSGITKDEYLKLGTLPEGLYSVCFEAYDYNRFLEPPVSNRSCATSKLEVHDPPVIVNPIGEQPLTTPQQLQFNWQNRHIGSFPVEYELRIYEKRKGLTDDQILVSMPPLFRVVTKLPTYNYGLKDPLLKEAQEYLTVVQVRDLTEKNYFKNLGDSKPETFVLKTPCRPGLACSDNDDCTINDTYDKDCNCIGTPFYDPNDDGISDPVTIPAPTIKLPDNEICVNDGKSVIAWTPNHNLNIEVEYDLSIWLEKVDVTQTREYIKYQQELEAELNDFLNKQKEAQSIFIKNQQAEKEELEEKLKAEEERCLTNVKQEIADFEQQQRKEAEEFAAYLEDFQKKCEADKAVAKEAFLEELEKEKAVFAEKQAADKTTFERDLKAKQSAFQEQQSVAAKDFLAQQAKDLAAFEAAQATSQEERQAQLEADMAAMKEAEAALAAEYETCLAEANNYRKNTRTDYLESIAPLQKEIGVINLVIQNLKTNFVDTRLKLKEQRMEDLANAKTRTDKRKIRTDYKTNVIKERTQFQTDLAEEKAKKADLRTQIAEARAALKETMADAKAEIEALKKACEEDYAAGLKNLENKEISIKNALANSEVQAKADYEAFIKKQAAELAAFENTQSEEQADLANQMKEAQAVFADNQATEATDFAASQAERIAIFERKSANCEALVAEESAYFERKQAEDKANFDKKIKGAAAICTVNTEAALEELASTHKQQQAEFSKTQSAESAKIKKALAERLAIREAELEEQYSKGLPKLVYTNKLDTLYQHILPTDYQLMPGYTYTTQVQASVPCSRVTIKNKGLSGLETFVISGEQTKNQPTKEEDIPVKSKGTPVTQNSNYAVPKVLPATALTTSSFQANWEVMKGAEYYILEVATDKGFKNQLPAYSGIILSNFVTSYLVEHIEGEDFYYRVRGGNGCFLTEFSDVIIISIPTIPDCKTGGSCDDGYESTINDYINEDCECVSDECATDGDDDNDGVCNDLDSCPDFDDGIDTDNDGIPDGCDSCISGTPCDDEDDFTVNDVLIVNPDITPGIPPPPGVEYCLCEGTPKNEIPCRKGNDDDQDGICNQYDICPFGDDLLDTDGDGIPNACDECPEGHNDIDEDNDGIPDGCDILVQDCNSVLILIPEGESFASSKEEVPVDVSVKNKVTVIITDPCDNPIYEWHNGSTSATITIPLGEDYSVTVTCEDGCTYTSEEDVLCVVGTACDDYDPCTINDVIREDCLCSGDYVGDFDNDGVCDTKDECPGNHPDIDLNENGEFDGPGCQSYDYDCKVGAPCDDGNPCTIRDELDERCNCFGIEVGDDDKDGICNSLDACPGYPDYLDMDGDGIPDGCDESDCAGLAEDDYCGIITSLESCSLIVAKNMGQVSQSYVQMIMDIYNQQNVDVTDESQDDPYNQNSNTTVTSAEIEDGDYSSSVMGAYGEVITLDYLSQIFDISLIVNLELNPPQMVDSDNDGVCDLFDICDGEDLLDENGNNIPDECEENCNLNTSFFQSYLFVKFDRECIKKYDTYPNGNPINPPVVLVGLADCKCECEVQESDIDEDGYIDEIDQCHGGDDAIDNNSNGIPDACDEVLPCIGLCTAEDAEEYLAEGESIDGQCMTAFYWKFNPESGECECKGTPGQDSDMDGVCDAFDQCPGAVGEVPALDENDEPIVDAEGNPVMEVGNVSGDDDADSDYDGIPNDCDLCHNDNPLYFGNLGDPCDDTDPCTIQDKLRVIGEPSPIADLLSIAEIEALINGENPNPDSPPNDDIEYNLYSIEAIAQITNNPKVINVYGPLVPNYDLDGNFINYDYSDVVVEIASDCGCYGIWVDSDNDGTCDANDQCEGWDDNDDYDNDGEPDGCDPPFYDIPCPITGSYVIGNFKGITQRYAASANIPLDESAFPNPVEFHYLDRNDLVVIIKDVQLTAFMEVESGDIEVFYAIPDLDVDNLPINDEGEIKSFSGVARYSSGQECSSTVSGGAELVAMQCPHSFTVLNGQFTPLVQRNTPFGLTRTWPESFSMDMTYEGENYTASETSPIAVETVSFEGGNAATGLVSSLAFIADVTPLEPLEGISGNITFDTGLSCDYSGGIVVINDCTGADGNLHYEGEPCDDGDTYTSYDAYDENCNCVGTMFHDLDGDGVHDSEDLCNEGPGSEADNDGNGVPDMCECPIPEIEETEVRNGNDIRITLLNTINPETVETDANGDPIANSGQTTYNSFSATWTPESESSQPVTSNSNIISIPNGTPGVTYTVAIQGICAETGFASNEATVEVEIPEDPNVYACAPTDIPGINEEDCVPVTSLVVGSEVVVSDFTVIIGNVTTSGATFSGSGYVEVPFFNEARVNLEFTDITVLDCDGTLYMSGDSEMNVTGAGVALISEEMAAQLNGILSTLEEVNNVLGEVQNALESLEYMVDQMESLDDYFSNGYGPLGTITDIATQLPYLPEDIAADLQAAMDCMENAGDQAAFEACKGDLQTAIAAVIAEMEKLYDADIQVPFAAHTTGDPAVIDQEYGFDGQKYQVHQENYHQIEAIADEPYSVAWKSVRSGQTDVVDAFIRNDDSVNPASDLLTPSTTLRFEHKGENLNATQNGDIYSMTVTGNPTHHGIEEIYAIQDIPENVSHPHGEPPVEDGSHIHIAGKLNVISYDEKSVNVVIVPVQVEGGTPWTYTPPANLSEELNDIYLQAGMSVNVTVQDQVFESSLPETFPDLPSGWLSAYNNEMGNIISNYQSDFEVIDDTYYFFMINQPHETNGKLGFMPKKRQFGFIFLQEIVENTTDAVAAQVKTIAHELGHGAFVLEHTFETHSDNPELANNQTDNLMDYGETGILLRKYQWDLIHDPASNITLLDSDEEGESAYVGGAQLTSLIAKFNNGDDDDTTPDIDESTITFLSPAAKPITFKSSELKAVWFSVGDDYSVEVSCNTEAFRMYPIGTLRAFDLQTDPDDTATKKRYTTCFDCSSEPDNPFAFSNYGVKDGSACTLPFKDVKIEDGDFYVLDEDKVVVGFPCFGDGKNIFQLGQINLADAKINKGDLPVATADPIVSYYGQGNPVDFHHLLPDAPITIGTDPEGFPDLISAFPPFSPGSLKDQIIAPSFVPTFSEEANDFIKIMENQASCASPTSAYVYMNANQIAHYPGFFGICGPSGVGLEINAALDNAEGQLFGIIQNRAVSYFPNGPYQVDESEPDYNLDGYLWRYYALASNWEAQQNKSVYKAYNDKFVPATKIDDFFNGVSDETTLITWLLDWQYDICAFQSIKIEHRIQALNILYNAGLHGNTFFEYVFGHLGDLELGTILGGTLSNSEMEKILLNNKEENIFNHLIRTTPEADQVELLKFFFGQFFNDPTTYYAIKDKIDDHWFKGNLDKDGYESFVSYLSYMLMHHLGPPSVNISSNIQTGNLEYDDTSVASPMTNVQVHLLGKDFGDSSFERSIIPDGHLFDTSIPSDGVTLELNSHIEESTTLSYPPYTTTTTITEGPSVTKTLPNQFVAIEFKNNTSYPYYGEVAQGNGANSDGVIEEGTVLVVPAIMAELLFRHYDDAKFNYKLRVTADCIGLAITAYSWGAASPIIGSLIVIFDATALTADALYYADQQYTQTITGESFQGAEGLEMWNNSMLYWGLGNIGYIGVTTLGRKGLAFLEARNALPQIKNLPGGVQKFVKTLKYLRNQVDRISGAAVIKRFDEQIAALGTERVTVYHGANEGKLFISAKYESTVVGGSEKLRAYYTYKSAGGAADDIVDSFGEYVKHEGLDYMVIPTDRLVSDIAGYSHSATLEGQRIIVNGQHKAATVKVLFNPNNNKYFFKVTPSSIPVELYDFHVLYFNKGWGGAAATVEDVTLHSNLKNWIKNEIPGVNSTPFTQAEIASLRNIMKEWDDIALVEAFNTLIGSNASLRSLFRANPKTLIGWRVLNGLPAATNPKLLTRFADDLNTYSNFRAFLANTPFGREKWVVLNKINASDHTLTDVKLADWFESSWMKDELFEITPPTNQSSVRAKYSSDDIAEVDGAGVRINQYDDVDPTFASADVKRVSPSGEYILIFRNGKAGCRNGGCFLAGTPVHYANGLTETIEKLNLEKDNFVLVHSPIKDEDKYTQQNSQVALSMKSLDNGHITPESWKCVEIVIRNQDGSEIKANLRRPNWWLEKNNADKIGNKVELFMSEMNIKGIGTVTKITENKIDTRIQSFKRDENNNFARPIIGVFERTVSAIGKYHFENGEIIIATPNHPFYSFDRKAYIAIEDFAIGETALMKNGIPLKLIYKQEESSDKKVYNLEVWRDHNFYVGDEGVLVHNTYEVELNGSTYDFDKLGGVKQFVKDFCEHKAGLSETGNWALKYSKRGYFKSTSPHNKNIPDRILSPSNKQIAEDHFRDVTAHFFGVPQANQAAFKAYIKSDVSSSTSFTEGGLTFIVERNTSSKIEAVILGDYRVRLPKFKTQAGHTNGNFEIKSSSQTWTNIDNFNQAHVHIHVRIPN